MHGAHSPINQTCVGCVVANFRALFHKKLFHALIGGKEGQGAILLTGVENTGITGIISTVYVL
jgi:hypothetical protein